MSDCSLYLHAHQEALAFKWIESEQAGRDLGEDSIRRWICLHWNGYLRARWIEHLQGKQRWIELLPSDFGLLKNIFQDRALLLNAILDHLKHGKENLDILRWAQDCSMCVEPIIEILEALDINSRRLACRFEPHQ